MRIFRNISLKSFNTFGLENIAGTLIQVRTEKEVKTLLTGNHIKNKPLFIIGGGSNLLFINDFNGTILYPALPGIRIVEQKDDYVIISAGAGVVWDKLVEWCVDMGFSGLENLSGIPGNVGAAPVQNIGAYGVEAGDVITKVRTLSLTDGRIKVFSNAECNFNYRSSTFKTTAKGDYLVTRVYFRLNLNLNPDVSYGSLGEEVKKIGRPTLLNIRKAVINTRQAKLPDPSMIGNAGSFFKNPFIEKSRSDELRKSFPGIPIYDDPSGFVKIAAGWMIEQCGWKGVREGDAGVHDKQALVLVNHGNATGKQIFDLSEKIKLSVIKKFGIELEREVEII
jgi:UDP-N-acetylmuramate dehydrogenase